MTGRLQREIERLKKRVLALGAEVEENVALAVRAVVGRDTETARRVIEHDEEVDYLEVDLEEECLKILALYQPVAVDLRFIIAVLKINSDLERISDLAGHLSERALALAEMSEMPIPPDLLKMAEKVRVMLASSLDALVNLDAKKAMEVCATDDEVDALHRAMYRRIKEGIRAEPAKVDILFQILSASRYLERMADQTTNIAEDVIYLVQGDIIRHRFSTMRATSADATGDDGDLSRSPES